MNGSQRYSIDDFNEVMEHPDFDPNKMTEMYAHGFKGRQDSATTRTMIASYRMRNEYNILALDWAEPANPNGNYTIAIYNLVVVCVHRASTNPIQVLTFSFCALQVGEILGKVLNETFSDKKNAKLEIKQFHAVGHSLGAQLMGVAARKLIEYSNGLLILER